MKRYFSAVLFIFSGSIALAAFSLADMVGTWRVDPSSYVLALPSAIEHDCQGGSRNPHFTGKMLVINEDAAFLETYVAGNRILGPQHTMPTNYAEFALIIKKEGSFVATNVPAGFFDDGTAIAELTGKWSLQTNSYVLRIGEAPRKYEYPDFSLSFSKPSSGGTPSREGWMSPVRFPRRQPSSPPEPVLWVTIGKSWQMLLRKQQSGMASSARERDDNKHGTNVTRSVGSETNRTPAVTGHR